MSYAQYKFTIFEEDLIEKYFPGIEWLEEKTCCKYILKSSNKLDFSRQVCRMMKDPIAKITSNKIDFWVLPDEKTFQSCPGNSARNIWEYYVYVCKEFNK